MRVYVTPSATQTIGSNVETVVRDDRAVLAVDYHYR